MIVHIDLSCNTHTRTLGEPADTSRAHHPCLWKTAPSKLPADFRKPSAYLWHCDAQGRYSLYSDGATEENYLRGVQAADSSGKVTFTSIFPAAYSGRWPHVHFEVYSSLSEATAAGKISRTSQLALPKDVCSTVYATDGYDGSAQNLAQTSLENDNVFGDDDGVHQLATVTGDVDNGYVAKLNVGV